MGSLLKGVGKAVKKVAKPEILLPAALLFATGGGSAALGGIGGALKGAGLKNILLNQAITAGLSKATTGKIDPKAQLLALGMSGLSGAAKPFTGPESIKQFGASTGLSKDASAALAQKLATNPAYVAPQTGLAGLFDKGAQFVKSGFANPLSLKGAVTYGLPAVAGAMMGKPKTEEQKNLGVDAQAQYDLAREMNRMMGGAYTDQQLNTITAPMLSQYGGEYETFTNPFERRRRPMFPGLNYSGLTRYAKDGGSIEPIDEEENQQIIMDALLGETTPGMNEDAIAEQMFDMMRREELNPTGRAMGGRVNMGLGGLLGRAFREGMEAAMKNPNLGKIFGRSGGDLDIGDVEKIIKAPPKVAPRDSRVGGIDLFGRRRQREIDTLQDDVIDQMMEMDSIEGFADGGAITGITDMINQNIDQMQEGLTQQMQSGFTTQEAIVPVNAQEQLGAPPAPTLQSQASPSNFAMAQRRMGQLNPQARRQMFMNATPVTIGNRQGNFGQLRSLMGYADGGSIPQTNSVPSGMQLDGRGGGFIPMGAKERKDDVPAMLAKNEFVMTADAVRGAGDGNVNVGAQRMYDLMNNLESKV